MALLSRLDWSFASIKMRFSGSYSFVVKCAVLCLVGEKMEREEEFGIEFGVLGSLNLFFKYHQFLLQKFI